MSRERVHVVIQQRRDGIHVARELADCEKRKKCLIVAGLGGPNGRRKGIIDFVKVVMFAVLRYRVAQRLLAIR